VQATLKGVKDVIADPSGAVALCKPFIPGSTDTALTLTRLQATILLWQSDKQLGYNESATWSSMAKFLVAQKIIGPIQDISQAYDNKSVI